MSPDEIVDIYEATFPYRYYYGDAVPKWFINYGPGVAAAFLGANVGISSDTVWFAPLKEKPLNQIDIQRYDDNSWWQRVSQLSRVAAQRWRNNITVSYTDIGGNLDILASLRGTENLLMDMLDCPDEVERATKTITQHWLYYFDKLHESTQAGAGHGSWGPLWSPGKTYMLQSDFSYMIAPDMFERFVLPDLEACCDHLDHSFYHLDGKGELPHLDMILSLEELHGVQWVPGDGQPSAVEWPEVLRKIRRAGKSCQISANAKEALQIAEEHGGNGFVFFISDPNLKTEDIPDFIKTLNAIKS
jgi:5-methyltetrahydrofolate--homocysteine methyltransferase